MNKTIHNILTGIAAAGCFTLLSVNYANAQQIDPTVRVSRDFETNTDNIHKSKLPTTLPDGINDFNLNFDYTIFDKKFNTLYEFVPLDKVAYNTRTLNDDYSFFAKLAYMSSFSPEVVLKYNPKIGNGFILGLEASHNSFWGDLPLIGYTSKDFKTKDYTDLKTSAYNRSTDGGLNFGYSWKNKELNIRAKYTSGYYTFYGANANIVLIDDSDYLKKLKDKKYMEDNRSRKTDLFETGVNFRSIKERGRARRFNYNFNLYYASLQDKTKLFPINGLTTNGTNADDFNGIDVKENYLSIDAKFGPAVGKYADLLFGVNLDLHNSINYNTSNYSSEYPFKNDKYCDIMNFFVEYRIQKNRWNMFLKAIASIKSTSFENSNKYYTPIFMNANFTFEISKGMLWWYGDIGGNNSSNGYINLLSKNKWINPFIDMRVTSVPISLQTGLRGLSANRFQFDIYAKYVVHKGLLQFVNYTDKYYAYSDALGASFNAAYSNHNEFAAGTKINYSSNLFNAGIEAEYRSFSKGKKGRFFGNYQFYGNSPWGYSPFEGLIYGEYNYNKKIFAAARLFIKGDSKGMPLNTVPSETETNLSDNETTIKGFANLCIDVKYALNKNFTLFISGSNILNSAIQYYPQYIEKGVQFGGGMLVKF